MNHVCSSLRLDSSQSLRDHAARWDDLWLRSSVTHPTAQAAMIANWLDHYGHQDRFCALVVRQGERFVAALPLVRRIKGKIASCHDVPGNEWSSAGELLMDPACDAERVCDTLIAALQDIVRSAFWFASVPIDASSWQLLLAAARRAHWSVDVRRHHEVGLLDLEPSWAAQQARLSAGMRKQLRRAVRRLETRGTCRLHMALPTRGESALGLLESGLSLEHSGWKGNGGTSILAHDRTLQFIHDQARALIAKHQLAMALLELEGRIIAFEFGWLAKQTYHSYKVAFDEQFAQYSPGQLLVYHLLQHFHASRQARAIDFLGQIDTAVRRWRPRTYWMGRLLLAPPRPVGRALVFAARHLLTSSTMPVPQ